MVSLRQNSLPLLILCFFASGAYGQSVQLPSFDFFTIDTTVSVPDRGAVSLGGINRVSEGATSRGTPLLGKLPMAGRLFKNRGIGRDVSTSNAMVTARIIDLKEEEERQVTRVLALRRSRGGLPAVDPAIARKADFLSRHVARRDDLPPLENVRVVGSEKVLGVDEIRRQNELAQQQRDRDAVRLFEKGRTAESAGKKGAAKVYYRSASRKAKGEFKRQLLARVENLSGRHAAGELVAGK